MTYITKDMDKMATSRKGLKLILAGVLVMIAGYILMMGGGSSDPAVFNTDMFDFRRTVAAPVVILSGVVVIIIAIMRKHKDEEAK